MGNRTVDLPKVKGIKHFIREIRYHEFSRQAIGILLVGVFAWVATPKPALFWFGAVISTFGILIRLYASGFVIKNKQLATSGPYSFVRHPLYTGNILMLTGFCLANGQLWPWLVSVFFLWFWYPPAISYEDRKLERIFGEAWLDWSENTPALLPTKFFSKALDNEQWSLNRCLIGNWEPIIVVYSIFCLWWLWRQLPSFIN
ncbi:MAG: isoprenylcysteine carboxylmethyltransferase family protein [Pseudomonadota bacterium]|nr:isoprenylcysteine carboxylmethyltransferase family protein [Pseudomonadota bacterium]